MPNQFLAAGAHVLRGQCRARHGQARTQRDDQERDGKADGNRSNGRGTEPPNPEGIGQLVAGLQEIGEDDRNGQGQQGARNGAFEEESLSRVQNGFLFLLALDEGSSCRIGAFSWRMASRESTMSNAIGRRLPLAACCFCILLAAFESRLAGGWQPNVLVLLAPCLGTVPLYPCFIQAFPRCPSC
jgi:hypothetical protein